jgi:hypothetical protein
VGVAYGNTVGAVISGIGLIADPKRPSHPIAFLPLWGDPIKKRSAIHSSSTSLAFGLRDAVNPI